MTLNVLHTVRSLRLDGVGKVIIRNLGRRDADGFRHHVCSLRDEDALAPECRAIGIEPVFLGHTGAPTLPRTLVRLVRLIRRLDIDVVHTNRTLDFALAATAARVCGVPVVSSIHWLGRLEDHPQDESRLPWIRRWSEMKATVLLHRLLATRIVTVSEAVKASYASLPGFPAERAEVVHPGLDMAAATPPTGSAARLRSELGLDDAQPVLLNIGRLDAVKGQAHLVPMMRQVRQRLPRSILLIAGEGELRAALRETIERHGVADAVVLLGARSDVDALLAAADALVLSSDSEAFPLPLLEAMRAGKPTVATRVGGVPEIVEDGVSGYLVPRGDPAALAEAVCRLFEQPGRAERFGRAGRERAEARFDLRAPVRRLEALYREVARRRPRADPAPAANAKER